VGFRHPVRPSSAHDGFRQRLQFGYCARVFRFWDCANTRTGLFRCLMNAISVPVPTDFQNSHAGRSRRFCQPRSPERGESRKAWAVLTAPFPAPSVRSERRMRDFVLSFSSSARPTVPPFFKFFRAGAQAPPVFTWLFPFFFFLTLVFCPLWSSWLNALALFFLQLGSHPPARAPSRAARTPGTTYFVPLPDPCRLQFPRCCAR